MTESPAHDAAATAHGVSGNLSSSATSGVEPVTASLLCGYDAVAPTALAEAVVGTSVSYSIPLPSSTSTRVKNKVAQSAFIRERLKADMRVYDPDILFLCRKYHVMHRKQHELLKSDHKLQREKNIAKLTVRDRWSTILEHPDQYKNGRIIAVIDAVLVIFTVIQFALETVPAYDPDFNPTFRIVWAVSEMIISIYFTLETLIRFILAKERLKFALQPLNIMDVVAVLPFYLGLIIGDREGIDLLKIVRTCRFFKLFRSIKHINYIFVTLLKISHSLVAPLLFLFTSVLIIASTLFFFEKGTYSPPPDGYIQNLTARFNATNFTSLSGLRGRDAAMEYIAKETLYYSFEIDDCFCQSTAAFVLGNRTCDKVPSPFVSILHTMWYTIVTMTTAGYGDFVPKCGPGKVIASVGLVLSTMFLAMPIAIVGVSFTETVADAKRAAVEKKRIAAKGIATLRVAAEIAATEAEARGNADGGGGGGNGSGGNSSGGTNAGASSTASAIIMTKSAAAAAVVPPATVVDRLAASSAVAALGVSKTAGEACLQHLCNALRIRTINFARLETTCAGLNSIGSRTPSVAVHLPASSRALIAEAFDHPNNSLFATLLTTEHSRGTAVRVDPLLLVHHLDAFFALTLQSWVHAWADEQLETISMSRVPDSSQVAQRAEILKSIRRTSFSASNWSSRLQLMPSSSGGMSYDQIACRGLATELTLSAPVIYRIVAIPGALGRGGGGASDVSDHRSGDANATTTPSGDTDGLRRRSDQQGTPRGAQPAALSSGGQDNSSVEAVAARHVHQSSRLRRGCGPSVCHTDATTVLNPVDHMHPVSRNAQILLNIHCEELVLPQDIAVLHVRHAFGAKWVKLFPATPSHLLLVNDTPVPWTGVVLQAGDTINLTPELVLNQSYLLRDGSASHRIPLLRQLQSDLLEELETIAAATMGTTPSARHIRSLACATSVSETQKKLAPVLASLGVRPIVFRFVTQSQVARGALPAMGSPSAPRPTGTSGAASPRRGVSSIAASSL